jgi:hypothetical protein
VRELLSLGTLTKNDLVSTIDAAHANSSSTNGQEVALHASHKD